MGGLPVGSRLCRRIFDLSSRKIASARILICRVHLSHTSPYFTPWCCCSWEVGERESVGFIGRHQEHKKEKLGLSLYFAGSVNKETEAIVSFPLER